MAEDRPRLKVYLESTISSCFTARPSADAVKASRQAAMIRWQESCAADCDLVVDEVHQIRHAILSEYGGDMKAYILALSQSPLTGFKVVRLEPAKPFAWNRGERPSRLNAAAGV